MLEDSHQKDISQYLYCKDFSISPFPGSYIEQPMRWIKKTSIIKFALSKREEREYNKQQQKLGNNNG